MFSFLLFAVVCFVHDAQSLELDIVATCETQSVCQIELSSDSVHTINKTADLSTLTQTSSIVITGSNPSQRTTLFTNYPISLTNSNITLAFDNLLIDGSTTIGSIGFLQINTNQATRISLTNCKVANFYGSTGAITATEDIDSFIVENVNDATTHVSVVDIASSDAFVSFDLQDSVFENNTNYASKGGVLSLVGHEFTVNIERCQFVNNRATGTRQAGGCISWDRSAIADDLQSKIDALDVDQFVYCQNCVNGTWTIASSLNISESNFTDNYAAGAGGVVYVIQTKPFDEQIFALSDQQNGSYKLQIIRDFELNSRGNTFMYNQAGQYGGVYRHYGYTEKTDESTGNVLLLCDDEHYRLNLHQDRYELNEIPANTKATQSFAFGAVLSSVCGRVNVQDTSFVSNTAKYGAALSIYASSSFQVDNSQFIGHESSFGAVYINGLLMQRAEEGFSASITNSIFMDNHAANDGAAISALIIDELIIDNCHFEGNSNKHYGSVSVQYFSGYNALRARITNSSFTENTLLNDDVIAGAAITAQRYDNSDASAADDYPLNCYDNNDGFDEDIQGLTLLVDSCQFSRNGQSAIGLRVASAYIVNSKFESNVNTESHGGAIQSLYSWFEVRDSIFINNTASQTGGAISTGILSNTDSYSDWVLPLNSNGDACKIEIRSSEFYNNSAELGGAVYISTTSITYNNTFSENRAEYGGAAALSALDVTFSNNECIDNNAQVHGGCLFQSNKYSNERLSETTVSMKIRHNNMQECSSYIGGAVFLRTVLNEQILIEGNTFDQNTAEDVGGAVVIGQLLPLDEDSLTALAQITESNAFLDNHAERDFDDFASYPIELYIFSEYHSNESSVEDRVYNYTVSPGISTTAALGGYDIFGQDFESFMITNWNAREENFEFFLRYNESTPFELLTVNSGSLSAGRANISFMIQTGKDGDFAVTYLGSNFPSLVPEISRSWQLVECPPGYGYNTTTEVCNLCERDTFKVEDGWHQCLLCLQGLSCRGGENVQILHKNWWDAKFASSVDETFFCRLGECCTEADGCAPDAATRCPDDRQPDSVGCGLCKEGFSALHGSHLCGDCSHVGEGQMYAAATAMFVIWPILLVFFFGITRYDSKLECQHFYSVSIIEITVILLIDYYQSLPAILTFVPDKGTSFLINLFFARIPFDHSGVCLFDGMTIAQKWYWDLLIPSLILILALLIFGSSLAYSTYKQRQAGALKKTRAPTRGADFWPPNVYKMGDTGLAYDPIRCLMFSIFFCVVPMLWSCAHMFKCIDYGEYSVFWNAAGQHCNSGVVAGMALFFVALTVLYAVSNISYSHRQLINDKDVTRYKQLIPLYLQRLQPFYFMVYPFDDQNDRRFSLRSMKLEWAHLQFRQRIHFKYLYVGWTAPFIRKWSCLLIHALITGEKGQSDQTFIVTNLTLATLVAYQLFSQDYTSADNYTLHLYCMYVCVHDILFTLAFYNLSRFYTPPYL